MTTTTAFPRMLSLKRNPHPAAAVRVRFTSSNISFSFLRTAQFSTSIPRATHRAIVFTQSGAPSSVVYALSYPSLPPPPAGHINVRIRAAPINPSDINVIEGVYPSKPVPTRTLGHGDSILSLPEPVFVPGNEGLAEVTKVGECVEGLNEGDWVVMAKPQAGTWSSARLLKAEEVVRIDKRAISEPSASMLTVNPPTAYCLLRDFIDLQEGDWVVQNGANSAVGQAVIQIAAREKLKTINFVRNRPTLDVLREQLIALGASHVFTYDDLQDRAFIKMVKELTGSKPPRLLLNCVSGPSTAQMTRLLGMDARLVSYGAMSKQPLSVPTGQMIFRGLRAEGFWMSRWFATHPREERERVLAEIIEMQLQEPDHKIVTIEGRLSDEEAGDKVRSILREITDGILGKKVILQVEDPLR
ncbi:uncharacterized protein FIBRA_03862 [Fibroporia radiculosa]|uniref:enoyl-[acyl-carrier-protein] reductase n=1 Tax=Fibroporia radiculosa TaxID=599839 RepID=J4GNQ4_9APHY|nr:uncharacterized protein FIBRA_03862 [Fibroporia radiculosa]CCM01795.1 predicted protein [Fibroporia radiculosa]